MKNLFILIFISYIPALSFSQDTITKRNGVIIPAKVLEISSTDVKYKNFDNQNGPTYSIFKSEVLMIHYENGNKEVFNEQQADEPKKPKENLFIKGQVDAARYYHGYKAASGTTLAVSLLSPLVGLVPAIGCSLTPPKEKNLGYPDSDLFLNNDYKHGYIQSAKKIKSGKIWRNWGTALGVNLILVLLFLPKQ